MAEPAFRVVLLNAPIRCWGRTSAHVAELMRELALLSIGQQSGSAQRPVPARMLEVLQQIKAGYTGVSEAQSRELAEAVAAGEWSRDLEHDVPYAAAEAAAGSGH